MHPESVNGPKDPLFKPMGGVAMKISSFSWHWAFPNLSIFREFWQFHLVYANAVPEQKGQRLGRSDGGEK
jgi:hypothetical protein